MKRVILTTVLAMICKCSLCQIDTFSIKNHYFKNECFVGLSGYLNGIFEFYQGVSLLAYGYDFGPQLFYFPFNRNAFGVNLSYEYFIFYQGDTNIHTRAINYHLMYRYYLLQDKAAWLLQLKYFQYIGYQTDMKDFNFSFLAIGVGLESLLSKIIYKSKKMIV